MKLKENIIIDIEFLSHLSWIVRQDCQFVFFLHLPIHVKLNLLPYPRYRLFLRPSFLILNNFFIQTGSCSRKGKKLVNKSTIAIKQPSNVQKKILLFFDCFTFRGQVVTLLLSWEYLKPNKDYFLQQLYFVLK